MDYLLYGLSGLALVASVVDLSQYASFKQPGHILSNAILVGCAIAAIGLMAWWPFALPLISTFALRRMGLDPKAKK